MMEFDSATQHKIKHTNTKSLSHESLPVNLIFSFFLFLRNNNNNIYLEHSAVEKVNNL